MKEDTFLKRADAILKRLEWSDYNYYACSKCCPLCGGLKPPNGFIGNEVELPGHMIDCPYFQLFEVENGNNT